MVIKHYFVPKIILLLLLLLSMNLLAASDANHKLVDGINIYVGILPAELIQDSSFAAESRMHRGIPSERNRYHIVVALFDRENRITQANVVAQILVPGESNQEQKLEHMTINERVTFGNYFTLNTRKPYQTILTVTLPDGRQTTATFEFLN